MEQPYQMTQYNNHYQYQHMNQVLVTPNTTSNTSYIKNEFAPPQIESVDRSSSTSSESHSDYPQEITWLFFRDSQWVPFQSDNHYKIEQAFTLGGIYVDISDFNFPNIKNIRVFPTRMYLSYLGMKYRLSCVIQG